ncbi:MAG: NAD-dependent epimerase/dehydratase family protein [Alphaproteobacteria bacterium]
MKVLVTGSDGFIGKNLLLFLAERKDVEVSCYTRKNSVAQLPDLIREADFVFHLAGVNRPEEPEEFNTSNRDLTQALCSAARELAETVGKKVPILVTSSVKACDDSPYGLSKRATEEAAFAIQRTHGVPVHVFRLPNVFGKWAHPNYNSAVATFCYNISRDLPVEIRDPLAPITLVYIDDLIECFIRLMDGASGTEDENGFATVSQQYSVTVGEVAALIHSFKESRATLTTERVGTGFARALYSTYNSYLPKNAFAYSVLQHADERGTFVELLKTKDSGQFSYFSALPGKTRGGHYHHSKTEKLLVVKGQARFKFRHMCTDETYELYTSGDKAEIVETAPGWAHDVTNIGNNEMIVLLWANEVFDRARPDTYACPL